ncbi:MAG: hypothetical protein WCJ74_01175 [bacterium]
MIPILQKIADKISFSFLNRNNSSSSVTKQKSENQTGDIINLKDQAVFSKNQVGGQTAHTIINNKTPDRRIKNADTIINTLKKYPIAAYRLHYSPNDTEVRNLVKEIDNILLKIGWNKIDPIQRLAGPALPNGVTIFMLKPSESFIELNNQLYQSLGNKGVEGQVLQDLDNIFKIHGWPAIELPKNIEGVVIFVGPNPTCESLT